jgi:hypothetical protein
MSSDAHLLSYTYDIGQELDLLGGEVAVGAVDLPVKVAGVEEEHRMGALVPRLPLSRNHSVQGRVTV